MTSVFGPISQIMWCNSIRCPNSSSLLWYNRTVSDATSSNRIWSWEDQWMEIDSPHRISLLWSRALFSLGMEDTNPDRDRKPTIEWVRLPLFAVYFVFVSEWGKSGMQCSQELQVEISRNIFQCREWRPLLVMLVETNRLHFVKCDTVATRCKITQVNLKICWRSHYLECYMSCCVRFFA